MCGGSRAAPLQAPPPPPPAPAAPVQQAIQDTSAAAVAQSDVGKLGRQKSRASLLVDKTSSIPGAGNASTGGLNIPN